MVKIFATCILFPLVSQMFLVIWGTIIYDALGGFRWFLAVKSGPPPLLVLGIDTR